MLKKLLSLIFVYFISLYPAFAIEEVKKGEVLTLERCIEIALNNSPVVNKAKARVKVAKANTGRAKAAWTPAIGVGTDWRGSNSKEGHHSHTSRAFGVDAGISQLIYDFGKTNSEINIQKFNTMAAEYELELVELETAFAVKEAYISVLAAKANKDVSFENVEINERQYEQIKAFFEEGIRSKIDFVNAEVNLSNAKIDYISAEDVYCDAMIALNKVLYITDSPDYSIVPLERFNENGEEKELVMVHNHTDFGDCEMEHDHDGHINENNFEEISLKGSVKEKQIVNGHKLQKFDKTFEEAVKIANENRPDLKSYVAIKDTMKESLKLTKRSWFPELSANAGYGYGRSHGTDTNTFSYGAELSIPMFRPVALKSEIDAAKAEVEGSEEDIKLVYQNVYYDVQHAMCETNVYERQIPLVLNRVKEAKENFELADGRYQEGIGNYIELQDARSKYLTAQQDYINTVYKYGIARAELDFAMGVK